MDEVRDAAQWLKQERARLGWSTTEVAKRARELAGEIGDPIKLTQQSISHFENLQAKSVPRWLQYVRHAVELGGLSPKQEQIRRSEIFEEYGLNPNGTSEEWLSGEERAWLAMRRAGAKDPAVAEVFAEQLDAVLLPEVQVSYSMGGGAYDDDWPVVQMVPFSRAWLRGLTTSPASELMVARGDGDSMMPTILDQDLVIIDRAQKSLRQQDRIWALSYGQLGMIKRVRGLPDGSYQINSDNAAVTPIHASDEEMHIVGRVVGIVRKI